jgi:hypothetical protein
MFNRPHFPVLLIILGLAGCFATQADHGAAQVNATADAPQANVQDVKPASELALLMRLMADHADSVKVAVREGRELPPYPQEIKTLFTATPTEGMHIDPITYPTFGNDYLKKVDMLYAGQQEDHPRLYNALVQSCANCHTTHCPGPMMRIKKMYVPL